MAPLLRAIQKATVSKVFVASFFRFTLAAVFHLQHL